MGRPKAAVTKERVTIRLSPEVLEHFRSQGPGWQTRIDDVLKELVHVTFTLRQDGTLIRVISARDMHRKERVIYEQAEKDA